MPIKNRDILDPLRNFRFKVTINANVYAFSEVTLPDKSTEAVEYYEGDLGGADVFRQLSGRSSSGVATLKRGVYVEDTTDQGRYDFLHKWKDAVDATGANNNRCDVAITLVDEAGDATKVVFQLINAWPIKYECNDLAADANDVFIETLELVHEGVERTDAEQDTAMFVIDLDSDSST